MGNKIYRGTSKVSSSSTPHRNMHKCLLQEKRENDLSIEKTWLLLQRQESHEDVWPMKLYTIAMSLSGQVICTFNIPSKTENLLCIQRHQCTGNKLPDVQGYIWSWYSIRNFNYTYQEAQEALVDRLSCTKRSSMVECVWCISMKMHIICGYKLASGSHRVLRFATPPTQLGFPPFEESTLYYISYQYDGFIQYGKATSCQTKNSSFYLNIADQIFSEPIRGITNLFFSNP